MQKGDIVEVNKKYLDVDWKLVGAIGEVGEKADPEDWDVENPVTVKIPNIENGGKNIFIIPSDCLQKVGTKKAPKSDYDPLTAGIHMP